jgi:hypothetical protein
MSKRVPCVKDALAAIAEVKREFQGNTLLIAVLDIVIEEVHKVPRDIAATLSYDDILELTVLKTVDRLTDEQTNEVLYLLRG